MVQGLEKTQAFGLKWFHRNVETVSSPSWNLVAA